MVESFLLLAGLGGVVMAAMLLGRRTFGGARVASPDPFARDAFSSDPVNYAHVRVAGFGGVGLMLAALVTALQYQLTTIAVVVGLVGGMAVGVALIAYRRRSRAS